MADRYKQREAPKQMLLMVSHKSSCFAKTKFHRPRGQQRMNFKLCIITIIYKALHDTTPAQILCAVTNLHETIIDLSWKQKSLDFKITKPELADLENAFADFQQYAQCLPNVCRVILLFIDCPDVTLYFQIPKHRF